MQVNKNTFLTGLRVNSVITFVTAYDGEGGTPDPVPAPDAAAAQAQAQAQAAQAQAAQAQAAAEAARATADADTSEATKAAQAAQAAAEAAKATIPKPDDSGTLRITQEHLNDLISKRVNKEKQKGEDAVRVAKEEANALLETERGARLADKTDLVSQMEDLKSKSQGSEADKALLQQQIDSIKNESLSAEEKAAQHITELEAKAEAAITLATEKDNLYKDYLSDNELRSAITANNAIAPDQLFQILKSSTTTEPKVDAQGNAVPGVFEVHTSINVKNDKGENETLSLTPAEAVAKLRSNVKEWGNQFNSEAKGGSGLLNEKDSPDANNSKEPPTDVKEYQKWRKTPNGLAFLGRDAGGAYIGK